jgi:glycosyltransferase involved in cell wall biosynthesis
MRRAGADVRIDDASAPAALYHLGNNLLHREIYRRAIEHPGVVVLHDAVLNHFFLGDLNASEYVAEFVHNYGDWSAELARNLWARRARSGADPGYFRYPMLRRIAETAKAVVVHNPRAAHMVREHAAGAKVVVIPHLFEPPTPPTGATIERLRDSLGLKPSTALLGVFGHLRESKRIAAILRAFEAVRGQWPMALLVAGDFVSTDHQRALAQPLRAPGVFRVPLLPEAEWWQYAHAVDCGLALRYPTAGETSGIAIRLMGIGKPVIVTAGDETADLPGAACIRVDPGPAEIDMLAEFMLLIARFPGHARRIGACAREHIQRAHSLDCVARMYVDVLEGSARA